MTQRDQTDDRQVKAAEERAAYVSALRVFAAWLEANPDIPTPNDYALQYSIITASGPEDARRAAVEAIAERLGVKPHVYDAGISARYQVGTGPQAMTYTAHTGLTPKPKSIEDAPPRGTDAAEVHKPVPAGVEGHAVNGRHHDEPELEQIRSPEVSGRWAGASDAERIALMDAARADAAEEDAQREGAGA